ncbi:unnamed protein product [Colias eurytheme]|nr:unnamed protein product [Colias eurytheme]
MHAPHCARQRWLWIPACRPRNTRRTDSAPPRSHVLLSRRWERDRIIAHKTVISEKGTEQSAVLRSQAARGAARVLSEPRSVDCVSRVALVALAIQSRAPATRDCKLRSRSSRHMSHTETLKAHVTQPPSWPHTVPLKNS